MADVELNRQSPSSVVTGLDKGHKHCLSLLKAQNKIHLIENEFINVNSTHDDAA